MGRRGRADVGVGRQSRALARAAVGGVTRPDYLARWHWPGWAFLAWIAGIRLARGDIAGHFAARVQARVAWRMR
jgi:hypothetical protein